MPRRPPDPLVYYLDANLDGPELVRRLRDAGMPCEPHRDHFAPDLLEISGDPAGLSVNATRTADGDKIYLKLVNPSGREVPVQIALRGDFPLLAASMQLVATDNPATGQPAAITPVRARPN